MTKKIILLLLVLPFFAFMQSGCENNSNAQPEVTETQDKLAVDFLQNIISGSVGEKISDTQYMLELKLSPNTVFTTDLPRRITGSLTTEEFYDNFDINFPDEFPNAILSINEGETPSSLSFEMRSPSYHPETNTLEVNVSVLEVVSDAGEAAVNIIDIDEIMSPFGQSSLFIDDAINTCVGTTVGTCSTGNNVFGWEGPMNCVMDTDCMDSGATCTGGSTGVCSITGDDCSKMISQSGIQADMCCSEGICLFDSPL